MVIKKNVPLVYLLLLITLSIFSSEIVEAGGTIAEKMDEKVNEQIDKEDNTSFSPGVTTEQFVRSIFVGKPKEELSFKDVTPVKKILVYKYEQILIGRGFKLLLFVFDKDKNQFVFWDKGILTKIDYLSFKQKKEEITKFYKSGWYVDTLIKLLDENNENGFHSIASNYATKLIEQTSEFEDLNAVAYNVSAWFWATCKDYRFRNVESSIKYASQAVDYAKKINNLQNTAIYLDTLAAAYAEKGDFAKAVEVETEAYNISLDKQSGVSLSHLNLFKEMIDVYKNGKSYAMYKYGENR